MAEGQSQFFKCCTSVVADGERSSALHAAFESRSFEKAPVQSLRSHDRFDTQDAFLKASIRYLLCLCVIPPRNGKRRFDGHAPVKQLDSIIQFRDRPISHNVASGGKIEQAKTSRD
jgi:hypothetical protein